jgi:hypothetical protein
MSGSQRPVSRPEVRAGALKVFRDALHGLYLAAGQPKMAAIAQVVRDNDDLPGSPSSDTIDRILRAATFPRNVANVEAWLGLWLI